ncbi:MAG: T9SS C-terminal target domain-containing protein [Haliscomenobacteraceae bacterium CHB4]|nr:hypothetical protein [Saprospiraceae bacterium]MCE7925647.1 T9SS C-terminal target domain-containing protein [Haliscomenobacteraceae bacterium CHB4]
MKQFAILTLSLFGVLHGNTQSFIALEIDSSSRYDYTSSIVGWGYFRTLDAYDYDNYGRLQQQRNTFQITEEIDGPSIISDCKRYTYTYGPNLRSWLVETCSDPDTSYNIERITQTLDPAGNVLHHLYEEWYMPEWYATAQAIFTYTPSGKMMERLFQQWDWMSSSWQNYLSELREYDPAGNEILRHFRDWNIDSTNWRLYRKISYMYDSQNQKIEEIDNTLLPSGYPPSPWKRNTWHYNTQGAVDTSLTFFWGSATWNKNNMETSIYDADGNLIENRTFNWSDNTWKPQKLQTFFPGPGIYGSDPDSVLHYLWGHNEQFEYTGHETFFYEDLPDSTVYYRHELRELMGTEWIVTILDEKWYQHTATTPAKDVSRTMPQTLCTIPNPYAPGQIVRCNALAVGKTHYVRVFDMTGRMVFSIKIENDQDWKIDCNLPSGLYNLVIFSQNEPIAAQKVVITRP